jgi:flagellar capping protein FliD
MHEELISLLAKEKEIITTRQSLLDKIRTNFNTNLANFNTDLVSIENLLRQKYPEAFL